MFGSSIFSGSNSAMTSFFSRVTNSIVSSIGGPSLRALGLSFSNIYRFLKQDSEKVESSLKDLFLQTSTYNKVIPEVYGCVRLAGNIIWASPVRKTSVYHPSKMTKYGSQSAYTEYMVRGSFAVAICKGVIDEIKNIYANNEVLNLSTYNIRIYYGTEQQMQDPTIQSYIGDNTPAFRGLCYVVFTEFPMEQFNNTIPNLTFDVVRNKEFQSKDEMENLVTAITLIPGSGEFVYDTITQKKLNGGWINGSFYENGKATSLNNHTVTTNTDAIDSLNDLQNTFPNLQWISLVVCWFCDSLDCGVAEVYPACENRSSKTIPEEWYVGMKTRINAKLVGLDNEGNLRYGATPSDACVKRYCQEIKRRGLKLCLYPMLMVDVDKKPWRGHIFGDCSKIRNFFRKPNGYNSFIKHYVNLLKDDIDAVIIGSEMVGITSIFDEQNNNYPAVDEFCNLANEVRQLVKYGTKITYTADWSEYHHDSRGNYNLDKLWANGNIDFIGIDAYFPLTDKATTTYDLEEIQKGWRSGEGYDFYYIDEERTIKENLSPQWAWKNIEWFWSNYHYDSSGKKTAWIPKSKKIWFMEYGFPSVDCATNQPNVFYSKGSFDSAFPRYSKGNVDFKAQRVGIKATELAWQNSECVENKFLYTWDARPYPYFPNLKNVWADADCWKYGHFLNGKSGTSMLSNIINYLCRQLNLTEEDYDTSLLKDSIIDGYVIDDKENILSHLKTLAITFNFDAYIDNGKIFFKSIANTQNYIIDENDLILDEDAKTIFFSKEHLTDNVIPSSVELLFINVENDYKSSTAIANDNCKNNQCFSSSIKIPMSISQAQEIAWRILSYLSNQSIVYEFKLPISYINISPLDTIKINFNNEEHLILVKNVELLDFTTIKIIGFSTEANKNILSSLNYSLQKYENNTINNDSAFDVGYIANTKFEIFELFNIKNEVSTSTFALHGAFWSDDDNWKGATLYYSDDDEENYKVLNHIENETSVGKLVSIKNEQATISSNYIDTQTEMIFVIQNENNKLQSISDEDFKQLKNKILIGDEIIGFRDVERLENGTFKISYLLRGRFNTDDKIYQHVIGENVILLDNDCLTIELPITQKNKTIFFKALSDGDTLLNVEAKKIVPKGLSTYDFEVKNLDKKTMLNGDIFLSFSGRKNYKLIDLSSFCPQIISILTIYDNNNKIIRTTRLENRTSMHYTTSMQKNDFGRIIGQNEIQYSVRNIVMV